MPTDCVQPAMTQFENIHGHGKRPSLCPGWTRSTPTDSRRVVLNAHSLTKFMGGFLNTNGLRSTHHYTMWKRLRLQETFPAEHGVEAFHHTKKPPRFRGGFTCDVWRDYLWVPTNTSTFMLPVPFGASGMVLESIFLPSTDTSTALPSPTRFMWIS